MENILEKLNPSQLQAVNTIDGPVLVVAGAGTGKTRVIEYRVLNMIQKGINPGHILLLTFTRRAAREMLNRSSRHDERCREVVSGTFHSFAYRILKEYGEKIGIKNMSFIDEGDAEDILHKIATRLGYYDRHSRFPRKETIQKIISATINREMTLQEILEEEYPHFGMDEVRIAIERLAQEFFKFKYEKGYLDYDDLLLYLKELLSAEDVQDHFASIYRYVMVDEYQDTNRIQAEIIYRLCSRHRNVLVVGDDAQSIYRFRGAYFQNMFDFPKRFSGTKIIKLEENYRSLQPILDVANVILKNALVKYTKVLHSVTKGEITPVLRVFNEAEEEAHWAGSMIKRSIDEGIPMHRICVLYRSSHHSASLQLELSRRQIPFAVFGGLKFIEMAHVKDVLSHLKILSNPFDEIAWSRVLMLVAGIGPRTSESIIQSMLETRDCDAVLKGHSAGRKYSPALKHLHNAIISARELSSDGNVSEAIRAIDEYYKPVMESKFDDHHRRKDDLLVLEDLSGRYKDISDFLADFSLLEPPEKIPRIYDDGESITAEEKPVTLSTIHSAKGLEWDVVFIIAAMDGSIPSYYSLDSEEKVEEERRLMYVAVTRCRRSLYMSMHRYSTRAGLSQICDLSRFLREPELLEGINHNLSNTDVMFPSFKSFDRNRFYREMLDKFKRT